MMGWLSRLFSGHANKTPEVPKAHRTEPAQELYVPANGLPAESAPEADALPAFPWLFDCAPLTDAPLSEAERAALDTLSRTLALPALPDNLLPRAAALIPQLIALVRQTDLPTPAIAERIGKDAVLTAEVLRLASSPYYRVQGDVNDLQQAISLIGLQGLQTVIARVLLKPIYQAAPGPLSGRAGPRMWDHSEALARHCGILAEQAGLSAFDGYLVGMLHDTGWTVALSAIDRAGITLAVPPSHAFAAVLDDKVYRLFGLAALRWDITPGFAALARDARANGITTAQHPLAQLLRPAHQHCMEELLAA
ncbi:MAG TPA: HDOD domain-containing protein [Burkholderiaceae bacterium]|nr:HDOD domain-containing protein [Burkholderiaceae bacterium]